MAADRVEVIEEVLIYHRNHKRPGEPLTCNCGYVHPLGRSIMLHRARLIDEAIRYAETGEVVV
jgi:hypothetical protein